MKPVVLDTNALLLPGTQGTDLEAELERLFGAVRILVPQSVVQEVDMLAQRGEGAGQRAAKLAKKLLQRFAVEATSKGGDDGVLEVARRHAAAVVTNDRKLQEQCRLSKLQVIGPREPGRLAVR